MPSQPPPSPSSSTVWGPSQKAIASSLIAACVKDNMHRFNQHPELRQWATAGNLSKYVKSMVVSTVIEKYGGAYPAASAPSTPQKPTKREPTTESPEASPSARSKKRKQVDTDEEAALHSATKIRKRQ
ncbi:unnamed protein product [Parajaminaea phylloscopi]